MAKLSTRVKKALLRAVEVVGTSASNLADNAKLKVAEINLETRRREILNDFCLRAYDLWRQGTELPEPLNGMLAELSELEEKLNVLHAQKYAKLDDSKSSATEAEDASADAASVSDDGASLDDGAVTAASSDERDVSTASEVDALSADSSLDAPPDEIQAHQADGPQAPATEPASYESTLGESQE